MLLGDSVVYGNHHVSQSETIAHYAKQALQETLVDNRVSVLSAAASSWGPKNQLEYLKERGLYESDLVFLVISTHDIFDFPTFKSSVIPYRVNKNIGATDDFIYAVYNRAVPWLVAKISQKNNSIDFEAAKVKTKSIIEEIFALVRGKGSNVILVFHPAEYQLMSQQLDVSFFENIAIDNGVKFIDLKSRYIELNKTRDNRVHYDGMHLTPKGAALVASVVHDETLKFLRREQ